MKRVVKKRARKRVGRTLKSEQRVSYSYEKVPMGVKVISVLYYIGAVLSWVSAFMFLVVGVLVLLNPQAVLKFQNLIDSFSATFGEISLIGFFLIIAGFVLVAIGFLDLFIAKGLVKRIKWTRTIIIVLSVLGFLSSLISLIGGDFSQIFGLMIAGAIGWYLWFSKQAVNFFK